MKKNGLTLAVAAGLLTAGGIADAVHINPDGTGEALIYPYYTVRADQQTHLSVVNTAAVGKAVKVRFLEGRNSREVLDFNLYLSPYDVWTGSVFEVPNGSGLYNAGGVGLITSDRSCTVPDIVRGGYPGITGIKVSPGGGDVCTYDLGQTPDGRYYVGFRPFEFMPDAYPPVFTAANGGVSFANCAANIGAMQGRKKEGYFEMIVMGDIIADTPTHNWALHNAAGEPGNCQKIVEHWTFLCYANNTLSCTAPGLSVDRRNDFAAPTGGIFGNAHITNAARGTVFGYTADALDNFVATVIHTQPGSVEPSLRAVEDTSGSNFATAQVFANGRLINARYDVGTGAGKLDAVSALFATRRVSNEFYLDETSFLKADSEWVITFPTKRFYVDDNPTYAPPPAGEPHLGGAVAPGAPYAPFTSAFRANGACEPISVTVYDREERTANPAMCDSFPVPPQCGFSPPRPGQPSTSRLCWESQVVSFNQPEAVSAGGATRVLGATYAENVTTTYAHGWANLNFPHPSHALRPSDNNASIFRGLPVTGFFVTNLDNSNLGAVLANYSALFHHRTQRECVRTTGGNTVACS